MRATALILTFTLIAALATCVGLELKHVTDRGHQAYEELLDRLEGPRAPEEGK